MQWTSVVFSVCVLYTDLLVVYSFYSCSMSEYADLHGKIAESLIWGFLLDLTKVNSL